MNFWILKPREDIDPEDNPWDPWYDKNFTVVVRANSENRARELAHDCAGDENRGYFLSRKISNTNTPWLDSEYSTCDILDAMGEESVIVVHCAYA